MRKKCNNGRYYILNSKNYMKLVSINIEFDKHHDTVIPFLKKENPDVICVQELTAEDFEMYKKELGLDGIYKPVDYIYHPYYGGPKDVRQGEGIFAKKIIETKISSERNSGIHPRFVTGK